jgi:hypothetical protein
MRLCIIQSFAMNRCVTTTMPGSRDVMREQKTVALIRFRFMADPLVEYETVSRIRLWV